MNLPRVDLQRRVIRAKQMEKWWATGDYRDPSNIPGREAATLTVETALLLRDAVRQLDATTEYIHVAPVACFDGEPFELGIIDSAVVPAKWTGDLPGVDFYCESHDHSRVYTSCGVCDGETREVMLQIANESVQPVAMERGAPLAVGVRAPSGLELIRRGSTPRREQHPNCLWTRAGSSPACCIVTPMRPRSGRLALKRVLSL